MTGGVKVGVIRGRLAQWAEHGTKNPGATLMQVQCPGGQGIFLPQSTFSADSLTAFIQPLGAVTCIMHVYTYKSQTQAATAMLRHEKTATASTALTAAVAVPR